MTAVVGCLVLVVGTIAVVAGGDPDPPDSQRNTTAATGPLPEVDTLLLSADEIDTIMATTGMRGAVVTELSKDISTVTPAKCHSLAIFASPKDFGDSGFTAMRAQRLEFESVYASQAVFQYDSPQTAESFVDSVIPGWQVCSGAVTDTADDGHGAWEYDVQHVTAVEHSVTAIANEPSNQHICQNRLQAASAFVVRVALCAPTNTNQAQAIADKIAAKTAGGQ